MGATVYLIPSLLAEEGVTSIPAFITSAVKECQVFFAENERTTRRYLKTLWKHYLPEEQIVIDDYEWFTIGAETLSAFRQKIREGKTIGIVSEAGCPGVADPGQSLVEIAQQMDAMVKPLVGPSSILLALMASGMNGQQFHFHGYLPIDGQQRIKAIREMESESAKRNCTQVFIETPYRNNQLLEAILKNCQPHTKLCIATEITGKRESIRTRTIHEWKNKTPDLHKQTAIFCLSANAAALT
jgi:16S rRNA (cytidine1402-2'-O)-methyltransferase